MHICFITNEYPTPGLSNGGVGTMVKFIGEYLASRGILISVVGEYKFDAGFSVENGVHVYRLPFISGKIFNAYAKAKAINQKLAEIHQRNPIHFVETAELGLALVKKMPGIKYVIRMHGGHHYFAFAERRKKQFYKAILEKISFYKADEIIAVSEYVKQKTFELLKKEYKATVIFNPLDTSPFYQSDLQKVVAKRVLFVGSVVEKKGIRQLCHAMKLVHGKFPEAKLLAIGRFGNIPGTKEPYFPHLVNDLPSDYSAYIEFLGAIDHHLIPAHIEAAEVCVFPSHMEALPLAWLEALGMGKPFIGSKTGPGSEVVKDGETGLLTDPFSPEDIAQKIIYLFEHPEEANRMAENAYTDVQARFRLEKIGEMNLEFYQAHLS